MYSNKAVIYYLKFLKECGYNYLARDKVIKNKQITIDKIYAYISKPHRSLDTCRNKIRWVTNSNDNQRWYYINDNDQNMILSKKNLWSSKVYSIDKFIKELEAKENENKSNE